jgi:hypothetical protein
MTRANCQCKVVRRVRCITAILVSPQNQHQLASPRAHRDHQLTSQLLQYDRRYVGMPLGQAVQSLRIGDIDGLEDAPRRAQLDALGFDWGELNCCFCMSSRSVDCWRCAACSPVLLWADC